MLSWLPSIWYMDRAAKGWRRPAAFAGIAALILCLVGIAFDYQRTTSYREELRTVTERTIDTMLQRIVGRLDGDLILADHMVHMFEHDADMDTGAFAETAQETLNRSNHVTAIIVAPNFKIGHIFTRNGELTNPTGLVEGLDMAKLQEQLRANQRNERSLIVHGNANGALALITPIRTHDGASWGAVTLVLNQGKFLSEAGIRPASSSISVKELAGDEWLHVAIRHVDSKGTSMVTGNETIGGLQPVSRGINVPGGRWEIMAAPKSGWEALPDDQISIRFFLGAIGLAILVPIFAASLLIAERNKNIAMLKAREANLLELSQRFNLALETSNLGIWEVTNDNHLFWDERASALHGKAKNRNENRLDEWLHSVHPDDLNAAEAHFFTCTCSTTACTEVYRVRLPDDTIRYLRSAGASYRNSDGTTRTAGIVWDVTSDMLVNQTLRDAKENSDIKNAELELALDELSNREQELEELSTRLDLALASYNCGIWESNPATRTEIWDARMCQLYGIPYTDGKISAQQWFSMIHPDDREMAARISPNFPVSMRESLTVRVPQPDGSIRYVRSFGKAHTVRDGSTKIFGIAFDVTADMRMTQQLQVAKHEAEAKNVELEMAKQRIEHNALHDPLTSLANRRKLDHELDLIAESSQSDRQQLSLLHLDLDRFKQINDTLGHAAGDAVLVYAAQVLTRNVSPDDLVARIGGDEFVILIRNSSDARRIGELAGKIVAELRQPVDFDGFACRSGVSIGIAQASGIRIDTRKMLVNADIALYRAKALGRNRYEFFTQNLQAEVVSHKRTADELLAAIENREFVTWYQPQFCAITHQLIGAEALVRWDHPYKGIQTPDAFLKIADELNVTSTIDQFVLETVLKDQMRWAAMGVHVPKISVNVSSKRLHDEKLIETLKTLQISPGQISFELVESIFLDESEDLVTDNLERIKALGIDVEIDDFGTGHTSIVSLLKLKPKRLKIDRQLVMPILISPQERALVRSIIEIARSLGVETVAEGVETMQHAAMLKDLGCDLLQGYAFARPLAFPDFTASARHGFLKVA
ncbi:putative bifunctional diguanylate cyclase/phosphodiesterase [Rhizobium oryzicola]|uniref:EAL domain-containing protein n=1 Tax=Rhizobium oryzicola TaxID=1232668 RepID=A0ABT8ST68_9HYPH|nr:EAL domain-containing protein [Rhizobium oryzicola]MDO1581284.1 EAL domain-containing protein [Rhizobium oryzicola]